MGASRQGLQSVISHGPFSLVLSLSVGLAFFHVDGLQFGKQSVRVPSHTCRRWVGELAAELGLRIGETGLLTSVSSEVELSRVILLVDGDGVYRFGVSLAHDQ